MKEKLNLRNAILWTVALVALIIFFASFGATSTMKGTVEGLYGKIICHNTIWGCKYMSGYAGGHYNYQYLSKAVASAPGIIGALLILLASGGLVAITFLIKDEKLAKILTFVAAGVILVAGVLFFFVCGAPWRVVQESLVEGEGVYADIQALKAEMPGMHTVSGYGIGAGIVAILLAAGVVVSQFIKNVQFIKSK